MRAVKTADVPTAAGIRNVTLKTPGMADDKIKSRREFIQGGVRLSLALALGGIGGLSAARNEVEGKAALAWAKNIWADMLV